MLNVSCKVDIESKSSRKCVTSQKYENVEDFLYLVDLKEKESSNFLLFVEK